MTKPTRREFCAGCAAGALGLSVVGCGGVQTLKGGQGKDGLVVIELAMVNSALSDAPAVLVDPGQQRDIMIIRKMGSGYVATSARCTHLGCMIEPKAEQNVCPCHGATFSADGKVTRGPAKQDLKVFVANAVGDTLEIQL